MAIPKKTNIVPKQAKISQHSLSEKENSMLAAIVQSTDDAIFSKSLDGVITSWNPAAEKMFGYKTEEIVGKSATVIFPPERQYELQEIISKVKKGIPVERYETQRKRKDGGIINVSVTVSPVRDAEGSVIGLSAIDRDITSLKQIEKERSISLAIVQSSDDAFVGMTLDGVIISWSPGAEKMFGYSTGEAMGKLGTIIYSEEKVNEFDENINKVKKGERIFPYETERKRKDGSIVDVAVSASPIKDEKGEIAGIAVIDRDITGLRRAAKYARSLIESSLDPLVTISAEGKITDVNEATVNVTGIPREKLIGTDFSNYFTEPEKAREGYQQVFAKGFVTDYPLTIRHSDGQKLTDVLYNASVYKDDKGSILGVFAAARDVTETKQASQYARSLIEASLDPFVTISPEGKITDVNEATIQITGVSRDKLIGSDFSNYFTEPEEAMIGYQQVLKEGLVRDYPLIIRHTDGTTTDVIYNATLYKDSIGKVEGIFAAARDVTERKKAEEQLHATSAYARSLIEASLDPLVTISPEGKITDINHATELITGVSREWLIGTDFSTYFTEPRKAREGYQKAFREGSVKDYPLAIHHASGRIIEVLYNATVYRDALGKVRGVFAAARDVTTTKQASQYARSLIEASLDPLVTISTDGKITDVNEATIKVTGVSRGQLVGTDFSSYFTEPEKARQGYEQGFKKGFVTDYPLTIRRKDGKLTDVLYNASVYKDDKGSVLGVFAAARDYSRVKQTTQQVEAANKELEAFSYSVSHDLRAPLRAIDGFVKILVEEYGPKLDQEAQRIISIIQKSSHQMGTLIDDLLEFSRLGRHDMRVQEIDMTQLAKTIVGEIKLTVPERTIEFNIQALSNAKVDFSLFRQVWINLLSNAVKFTRLQKIAKIEIGSNIEGKEVVYYVKDNGAGFDMRYASKLFGVFQRLHSTEEFEGTGVGLAMVSRIITRHGGRVWAEGKVGGGATFYFALPASLK